MVDRISKVMQTSSQSTYAPAMKPTELILFSLDENILTQAEAVLASNETLSGFVTEAIQRHIQHRRNQRKFFQRELPTVITHVDTGEYVTANAVLRKLSDKLSKAKARHAK